MSRNYADIEVENVENEIINEEEEDEDEDKIPYNPK